MDVQSISLKSGFVCRDLHKCVVHFTACSIWCFPNDEIHPLADDSAESDWSRLRGLRLGC